jgi:AcrR family transcriptional regulator
VDPAQRREERRDRLIRAAVEVFGTDGYRNATVDRVCACAGLTKRYFYESFSGSEELLLAAYDYAISELLGAIARGHQRGHDARSRRHAGLSEFFATIAADPRVARLAFLEILGVSPRVDRRYREATRAFVDTLMSVDEETLRHSLPPGAHPRVVVNGLVGATLMMAQQWLLSPHPHPIETVVASVEAIFTGVLDGTDDGTPH